MSAELHSISSWVRQEDQPRSQKAAHQLNVSENSRKDHIGCSDVNPLDHIYFICLRHSQRGQFSLDFATKKMDKLLIFKEAFTTPIDGTPKLV